MQPFQPPILISFLIGLLIVACGPSAVSDSSGGPIAEQPQNQRRDQQLPNKEDLAKQEKGLKATAIQTLKKIAKQLQKENAPTQSLFKKLLQQLKKDTKQAKKNPKVAAALVQENQALQAALQELIEKLSAYGNVIAVANLHPTLQTMSNAVFMIPEMANANTANGGVGRPIHKDHLVRDHQKWYECVIQRHFKDTTHYDTHVRRFITTVIVEDAQRLQRVIQANLALFKNILAQHQSQ